VSAGTHGGGNSIRSTRKTEILGGVTTFVSMAYIIVVNPAILAAAGLPTGPSTVATILVAVAGTLLMGLYAKRPIAVAPYMGENAFIAYGLAALGVTWQQRLGAVFVSGIVFLIITLAGIRTWLADAISPSMKHSFAVGIGLFLAFIGLNEIGVVASSPVPGVPVKIGNLRSPEVLLGIVGFIIIMVLLQRRVRGAIIIGIAVIAVAGIVLGYGHAPRAVVAMPVSIAPIALKLDILGVLRISFLPILLTLFVMSFLDTLGTLVGLGAAAEIDDLKKPMLVDAISCTFSGLVGTSTSGAYIESATGIREGARTGLAAVTTAALFALSLFFVPLVEPLQQLRFAYAPALIAVGVLMIPSIRNVDFDDMTELVPAFVTIVVMVFTYNIGNGLTAGLVLYPVIKLLAGRKVNAGAVVLALICLSYYLFGLPH
jgi:AGZA family xanthine/uracil permease-like MFS transporter